MDNCAGVYITTNEALDAALDPEELWTTDPQRAIAITTVRALIYDRAKPHLAEVILEKIHGE